MFSKYPRRQRTREPNPYEDIDIELRRKQVLSAYFKKYKPDALLYSQPRKQSRITTDEELRAAQQRYTRIFANLPK